MGARTRAPMGLCKDMNWFSLLIPLSLVVVLAALLFGIYTLFRGGDFGRSWSNKAMRLRVLAQFVAILLLIGAMAYKSLAG
jgi:hypothetical protein